MEDMGLTASAVISFVGELEDNSAAFYERLAERWVDNKEAFLRSAEESRKSKTSVLRTYRETISDALESGFSFEGLSLRDYTFETALPADKSYPESIIMAIKLEENASRLYSDLAERSKSLLATIYRAFRKAAQTRSKRKLELQSLLDAAES